jgi:hemolysin-activating ACP:hemolysin acyltransferase
VWLVDLIAPFADGDNRHREIMIADLFPARCRGLVPSSTKPIPRRARAAFARSMPTPAKS